MENTKSICDGCNVLKLGKRTGKNREYFYCMDCLGIIKDKTQVDKLLIKLNKGVVDNDKEFLNCLIDLDNRLKEIEKYSYHRWRTNK